MTPLQVATLISGLLDVLNLLLDVVDQSQDEPLTPEQRADLNARTTAMVVRAGKILNTQPPQP